MYQPCARCIIHLNSYILLLYSWHHWPGDDDDSDNDDDGGGGNDGYN